MAVHSSRSTRSVGPLTGNTAAWSPTGWLLVLVFLFTGAAHHAAPLTAHGGLATHSVAVVPHSPHGASTVPGAHEEVTSSRARLLRGLQQLINTRRQRRLNYFSALLRRRSGRHRRMWAALPGPVTGFRTHATTRRHIVLCVHRL